MKSIAFTILISLSTIAKADLLSWKVFAINQCNRASNSALYTACMASTLKVQYYSGEALLQCSRIGKSDLLAKCIMDARNGHMDLAAVLQCRRHQNNQGIADCIVAIKNKKYSGAEIVACERYNDSKLLNQCLSATGSEDSDVPELKKSDNT